MGRDFDQRYAHIMAKLAKVDTIGALAIQVLTVMAVYRTPRSLAWVLVGNFTLMPVNLVITLWLLKRWSSQRAEILRVALNVGIGLVISHAIGWPAPVWLWVIYIALAFEAQGRMSWLILGLTCAANAALALHDGVPWLIPLSVILIAVFARFVTDTRIAIVHDMFERSEAQRLALDGAHDALKTEVRAREYVELELRQAQKLEAIGRLASGVAHEINTPLQYVSDSVHFLEESLGAVVSTAEPSREALDELRTYTPDALRLIKDGVGRVSAIVSSLREFAHPTVTTSMVDVNHVIESVLTVSRHEYKYTTDVRTELGDVPHVSCNASELNQALLNLIVNAAHAVADRQHTRGGRGNVVVTTRREKAAVVIEITDDGCGIDPSLYEKVFEPFFTTKAVGRGTGQGLAIARTMVERHGGTLSFSSDLGIGTTFYVRLPTELAERAA